MLVRMRGRKDEKEPDLRVLDTKRWKLMRVLLAHYSTETQVHRTQREMQRYNTERYSTTPIFVQRVEDLYFTNQLPPKNPKMSQKHDLRKHDED